MKKLINLSQVKRVLSIEPLRVIIFSLISTVGLLTYLYIGCRVAGEGVEWFNFLLYYLLTVCGVAIGVGLNRAYKSMDLPKAERYNYIVFPGTFQACVIIFGGILLYKVVEFIIRHV